MASKQQVTDEQIARLIDLELRLPAPITPIMLSILRELQQFRAQNQTPTTATIDNTAKVAQPRRMIRMIGRTGVVHDECPDCRGECSPVSAEPEDGA